MSRTHLKRGNLEKTIGSRNFGAYLIAGGKGQGKSTYLRDMIDEYFMRYKPSFKGRDVQPRVFIHDFSEAAAFSDIPTVQEAAQKLNLRLDHPLDLLKLKDKRGKPVWREGALRYVCMKESEIKEMYDYISNYLTNSLLILDEWTTYVKYNPPAWQLDILIKHRNRGIEVFFVVHQLMKVPLLFSRGGQLTAIVLFKTGERNLQRKDVVKRYSCAEKLWPAFNRVTKAPVTNKRTQYYEIVKV